jgi:hypothetical protein
VAQLTIAQTVPLLVYNCRQEKHALSLASPTPHAPKKRDSDTELAFGLLFGTDHSSCMFNSTNVMKNKQIYGQRRGKRSVSNQQKQAE